MKKMETIQIVNYGKMRLKKGQLKIQQMAFMLIAVTLFFVLIGLFLLTLQLEGLKNSATKLEEKNVRLLIDKIASSPEFYCGDSFEGEIDCVDLDKVMALYNNIDNYRGFWGVAKITIEKVYPKDYESILCTQTNYPNCGEIDLYSSNLKKGAQYSNFVALCRKEIISEEIYDKCELGRIFITNEDKTE